MKNYFAILFLMISVSLSLKGQQIMEDLGHYTQVGLPIAALGVSLIKGDKEGSIQFIKSFAMETFLIIGFKRRIDRERPNGRSYSFPSGHTAVSFMSSTYLWKRYGWEIGIPASMLAAFVGYSRFGIDEPVHFFSDVIAGAAIGIGSSILFTTPFDKNANIKIIGDTSFVGVKINYTFK